ncbi:MAC/Perforin domain-containing protein [Perilla frutescens var. frutescens]|nr:MAC/Perforin domain-containing protein [Perilla frutescens var. frutescens]
MNGVRQHWFDSGGIKCRSLGRGFDVTSDIKLLYYKGAPGSRLVNIDDHRTRNLQISESSLIPNVSVDIECSKGRSFKKEGTPVLSFREMAGHFNENAGLPGQIPLGCFNAMFNFRGSWQLDAAATISLTMNFLQAPKMFLCFTSFENYFIETYSTHIVTSVTIGGRDVVYVRQPQSSPFSLSDTENYVKDIGDQRFTD